MNRLSDLVEFFVQPGLRPFNASLAKVDGIGQQRTGGVNAFTVTALCQLNAFAFEKLADMLVKFIFINRFHSNLLAFYIRKRSAPRQL